MHYPSVMADDQQIAKEHHSIVREVRARMGLGENPYPEKEQTLARAIDTVRGITSISAGITDFHSVQPGSGQYPPPDQTYEVTRKGGVALIALRAFPWAVEEWNAQHREFLLPGRPEALAKKPDDWYLPTNLVPLHPYREFGADAASDLLQIVSPSRQSDTMPTILQEAERIIRTTLVRARGLADLRAYNLVPELEVNRHHGPVATLWRHGGAAINALRELTEAVKLLQPQTTPDAG